MKLFTLSLALAVVAATPVIATAQGNSYNSPGHQMQEYGSTSGEPGASGYAPGHNKDTYRRSGTTGRNHRDRDDYRRGDYRDRDQDDMRRGKTKY